jgi:hypothetical protein
MNIYNKLLLIIILSIINNIYKLNNICKKGETYILNK